MENNEQILVKKVDGTNNVFVIDPNAVIDTTTLKPKARYVKQEDLMIYVEVRAFMNPKTRYLDYADKGDDIINITKGMFYSSAQAIKDDRAPKQKFTTDWTEMFNENRPYDVEGFGINSIDIDFNASLVPKIHIEFIDVRGKNLLERGGNTDNPYNVFYVMPYPLFELTVKGYFGKAIRIPMVMEKAITKFDPATASYIISADFKSWTFAILNDLILLYALIVPYMFPKVDGTFEGQEEVIKQYNKILDITNKKRIGSGKKPITVDDDERSRINLLELFTYNEKIAKVFGDSFKEHIITRNLMVDSIKNIIESLKKHIEILKKNVDGNSSDQDNINDINKEINSTNKTIELNIITLKNLGYSELGDWVQEKNKIIKLSTLIKNDKITNKLEIIGITNEQYSALITPLLIFRKKKNNADIITVKNKVEDLKFKPTVENVVKTVIVHLDAFMSLLIKKTGEIYKTEDISENSLKLTKQQLENVEYIEIGDGIFQRLPWSEFYMERNIKGTTILDQTKGKVKSYPGNSYDEKIREWGEVKFIDAMFASISKLNTNIQILMGGGEYYNNIFIMSPIEIQNPIEEYSFEKTINETVNQIIAGMLLMVYHNGLLYRQVSDENKKKINGIYGYFINNTINYMLPEEDLPENTAEKVNLLKSEISSLQNNPDKMKKYLNTNRDAINGIIEPLMKLQDDIFIKPNLIYIKEELLPTEGIIDNYLVMKNDSKSYKTTHRMAPSGLLYHPKAIEGLNLFNFNNQTNLSDIDNVRKDVSALSFTNNYQVDDMFIIRR